MGTPDFHGVIVQKHSIIGAQLMGKSIYMLLLSLYHRDLYILLRESKTHTIDYVLCEQRDEII